MTVRVRTLRPALTATALGIAAAGLVVSACAPTTASTAPAATASDTSVASGTGDASATSSGGTSSGGTSATSSADAASPSSASPSSASPSSATTGGSSTAAGSAAPADACAPATLRTRTPGTLTLATSQPAYEPWVVANDPASGKGYESAVATAAAARMGYARDHVRWVRADFNAAIAPGPKAFDADVNQFSITAARAKVVDFSAPYYDVTQAVVYLHKDSRAAAAAKTGTVAGLRGLKLGAQVGTTSYDAITSQLRPTTGPAAYPSNDNAVQGLKAGQIDALVVDLPTALYLTSAELTGAAIAGQLPAAGGTVEQFGMLLPKGSPVTACLSRAVSGLAADGTLKRLEKTWLTRSAGAPVLR